ncbi:MAG: hypothetical protein PWQ74_30 [Methanobacteriaceae archaeon]|nr:hypothetical protein [Methanobacteriaceae archaeon]
MKIGVVVHGPQIVDSGYALKIIKLLKEYGKVKALLGGTMGRTAVYDAHLENLIDISKKRLPSQSIDKLAKEGHDIIFLLNYGKSKVTGHGFGYKVFMKTKTKPKLIQIERPGEKDGTVIPWQKSAERLAKEIADKLGLQLVKPENIIKEMPIDEHTRSSDGRVYRRLVGVSKDENIFVNGIVIGKATSDNVILVAEDGIIKEIIGGQLKKHGVEKLGPVDLDKAIVKTGLLRRSDKIKPRKVKTKKPKKKLKVAFLDHAAEDIYTLKDSDLVVTVGDDTSLVAADILYRFDVPIIGITDGDIDKVVEKGFKTKGSMIIEFEKGWDDIIGRKIFNEIFKKKYTIEIENIENFKKKILKIINNMNLHYLIKEI